MFGLNWNCHVRESEADQKKNNLYRIEFNCNSSILYNQPPPLLPPPPPTSHRRTTFCRSVVMVVVVFATVIVAYSQSWLGSLETKRNLQAPTVGCREKKEE